MASSIDDKLFDQTISSYRDLFWDHFADLPEDERNRLWVQRLNHFIPAPSPSRNLAVHSFETLSAGLSNTGEDSGSSNVGFTTTNPGLSSSEMPRRRTQQDASQIAPGVSGAASAKQQATVRLLGSLSSPFSLASFHLFT